MHVNVQLSVTEIYRCFFLFSRKEGDNEFMNIIANEINTQVRLEPRCLVPGSWLDIEQLNCVFLFQETLVFLTVGEEKGPGLFVLAGPSELVAKLGPQ